MSLKNIGLLTDFGIKDYYVSAIKNIIYTINPQVNIIDISHNVNPWNIVQGAFVLKQSAKYFPKESILVGIIDPTVGSQRKNLIIQTDQHIYIGPDNGLLIPAAEEHGITKFFSIDETEYMFKRSGTFDGRDVFAPIAGHLSKGIPPEDLGSPINKVTLLKFKQSIIQKNTIHSSVLHVDTFGNLITNLSINDFDNWAQSEKPIYIKIDKKSYPITLSSNYKNINKNIGLIKGSSDLIEISMKQSSASNFLKLKPNDDLVIYQ